MDLTFGELTETPLGPISFYAGDCGLQRLAFSSLKQLKEKESLQEKTPSMFGLETIGVLLSELNEYLFGIRKVVSVTIDWEIIRGFQREVLTLTCKIPYGQVRTYGEIAESLGKPKAARAVGAALGSNPMPIIIPCHRVIGSDGRLQGYIDGIQSKALLLTLEGHQIVDGKIK